MRISERIFLKDRETLQFDIVTVAPEVLTDRTGALGSTRGAEDDAHEITFCADYDRSIDPGSGQQRFDLTPPADLPPPPAR